jgi:uncharacterized surface protein with fasciclin (FAS1) repeats
MNRHRLFATSALALSLAVAPLAVHAADVVETLKNSQQFSTLADAIEKAGLAQTLQGDGPYTVFAPTDEAFRKMQQSNGSQQSQAQASSSQTGQTQGSGSQSGQQQQAASGQSGQTESSSDQSGQQGSDGQGQLVQQLDREQLKQVLSQHVIEGQELLADDVVGKEQKVSALSGDELTVDGTGTTVVLVPTGLSIARVGDEVFVRRDVAAAAVPAVTVSPTGQQGQEQSSQSQSGKQSQSGQQSAAQSSSGQQGQQSDGGQQGQQSDGGQQQATAQSGGQGQSGQGDRPIERQQGLLRAAMVVEPDIQADNGVIHAIDQVIVPEKIEQQLQGGQGQESQQES